MFMFRYHVISILYFDSLMVSLNVMFYVNRQRNVHDRHDSEL